MFDVLEFEFDMTHYDDELCTVNLSVCFNLSFDVYVQPRVLKQYEYAINKILLGQFSQD